MEKKIFWVSILIICGLIIAFCFVVPCEKSKNSIVSKSKQEQKLNLDQLRDRFSPIKEPHI